MKVLNGFSRKGQQVEHDLLSGQPQVLWPVAVHFMGAADCCRHCIIQHFLVQNTVGYSNPVESFRHVLVAKNTINRYHK